jgi:2-dehydropantoate 2-reductase
LSENILQNGWEKWTFIAALAGSTCLMRAAIGHILKTPAHELPSAMLSECSEIAKRGGFPMREAVYANARKVLTLPESTLSASMLHDIERGARTEADHILGDLLRRRQDFNSPLLELAYSHVKAYETRQAVG